MTADARSGQADNILLNNFEYAAQKTILKSTPPYVTIGSHAGCNAKCVFCLGGDFPHFSMKVYRELFEPRLGNVLKNADHVGFCGFGETLLMPGIEGFLDHVNATLPSAAKVFTTNGFPLKPGICGKLTEGRYSLIISLHAANAELHRFMTGMSCFDTITGQIRHLVELRQKRGGSPHINLVFIVTRHNIDNLPQFVMLAKQLGVDRISCNYLGIFEPEQVAMSCFFEQEKTNRVFEKSAELAEKLHLTLCLPPRFGKHEGPHHPCQDPWNFFYVETQGSVNPCCFAGNHIGYLDRTEFEPIWNGPGYTMLREGLVSGNIHTWCRHCYKFDPNNVNDIRSHITFRPETQKKIIDYLKEHRNEYPVPEENLEL